MDKNKALEPFFSRFLEGGMTREELLSSKAGRNFPVSRKYPSDDDESELRWEKKKKKN